MRAYRKKSLYSFFPLRKKLKKKRRYNYKKYVAYIFGTKANIQTEFPKSPLFDFFEKKNRPPNYNIQYYNEFIIKKRKYYKTTMSNEQKKHIRLMQLTKTLDSTNKLWLIDVSYTNKFGFKKKGKRRTPSAEKKIAANKLGWQILKKRWLLRSWGFKGFWKGDKSGDIVFFIIVFLTSLFYSFFLADDYIYEPINWFEIDFNFDEFDTYLADLDEFFGLKKNPFELKKLFDYRQIFDVFSEYDDEDEEEEEYEEENDNNV